MRQAYCAPLCSTSSFSTINTCRPWSETLIQFIKFQSFSTEPDSFVAPELKILTWSCHLSRLQTFPEEKRPKLFHCTCPDYWPFLQASLDGKSLCSRRSRSFPRAPSPLLRPCWWGWWPPTAWGRTRPAQTGGPCTSGPQCAWHQGSAAQTAWQEKQHFFRKHFGRARVILFILWVKMHSRTE